MGPGKVVFDPFCGSGTVPTTARALGARGVGVDLMPIAAFVAQAKGEWDVDPSEFWAQVERALDRRGRSRLPKPFLKETDRQFDPAVIRSLLRLKQNVWATPEGPVRTLLRLVFASILIDSSHLKRAPCLGYTTKTDLTGATPFQLFRERGQMVREDLEFLQAHRETWGPRLEIHLGNSAHFPLAENSVDLAVTSPPYVNGMDYVMNYKIDLAWMDFVRSYDELARLRGAMVACDNIPRSVAAGHRPSLAVRSDRWVASVTRAIGRNIRTKGSYRRADMAAVVAKDFDDLVPVIATVYRGLRAGARFVVVNGDSLMAGAYVPGDLIFARLAARMGFEVESLEVARTDARDNGVGSSCGSPSSPSASRGPEPGEIPSRREIPSPPGDGRPVPLAEVPKAFDSIASAYDASRDPIDSGTLAEVGRLLREHQVATVLDVGVGTAGWRLPCRRWGSSSPGSTRRRACSRGPGARASAGWSGAARTVCRSPRTGSTPRSSCTYSTSSTTPPPRSRRRPGWDAGEPSRWSTPGVAMPSRPSPSGRLRVGRSIGSSPNEGTGTPGRTRGSSGEGTGDPRPAPPRPVDRRERPDRHGTSGEAVGDARSRGEPSHDERPARGTPAGGRRRPRGDRGEDGDLPTGRGPGPLVRRESRFPTGRTAPPRRRTGAP